MYFRYRYRQEIDDSVLLLIDVCGKVARPVGRKSKARNKKELKAVVMENGTNGVRKAGAYLRVPA